MISFTIFFVTFWLLLAFARMYRDLLAPLPVMIAVWGGTLGLYYLKLIRYDDLKLNTLFVIGLGLAGFFLGSLFIPRSAHQGPIAKEVLRRQLDPNRLFLFCTAIFAVGLVGELLYLRAIDQTLGLANVLQDPSSLHFEVILGSLSSLGLVSLMASTNLVGLVFLTVFLLLFSKHKAAKLVWLQLLLTFAAVLFRTSRTGVFIPVLWSTITWIYFQGGLRIKKKHVIPVVLIGVFLIVVFVIVSSLVGKTEDAAFLVSYWRRDIPFNAGLASLYHYTTSALPAFQILINDPSDYLWGQASFLPILRIAQIVIPDIELTETIQPTVYMPVPTNVFTYLAPYYQDFGLLGLFIMPFILGLVAMAVYQRWKKYPDLATILISALLTTTIFWATFQSILVFTIVWYFGVVAFIGGKFVTRSTPGRILAHRPTLSEP
jgi:oligosaccharide repeat unit polymerase